MEKPAPHALFSIQTMYNEILTQYQRRLQIEQKIGKIPPNKSQDIINRTKEILKDNLYLLRTSYRALLHQQEIQREEREQQEREEQKNALNADLTDPNKDEEIAIEDEFEFMEKGQPQVEMKPLIDLTVAKDQPEGNVVKKEEERSDLNEQDENAKYEDTKKLRKHVLANLDLCFEGVFISSRKKYIAKSERTRFDLENVFMKQKGREVLYKTVNCDLLTIKNEEVLGERKL